MQSTCYLDLLHHLIEYYYKLYQENKISKEEYLYIIKPIDREIDSIELDTLNIDVLEKTISDVIL